MGIFDWSKTANSNTSLEGVTAAEGMSPAAVNNLIRAIAAGLKEWQEDMGAAVTAGGSADALTLTTNSTLPALADGQELSFVAASTNTGAATLAVDGLTAKAIRRDGDVALVAGNIVAGGHYTVSYDASANSASGAWMLRNPTFILDIGDFTEETTPAADDEIAFGDTSNSGATKRTTWQNILAVLGLITAETSIASDDTLPFNDLSASGAARKMTISNFAKFPNVLTELDSAVDGQTDYVLIIDATDGAAKKVLVKRLSAGTRSISFRKGDMEPITSAAPAEYAVERGTTNDVMVTGYAFDDTATEIIQIRFSPPFNWDAGDLQVKLRWVPAVGAGAGGVRWRVRSMCLGDGTDVDNAWGTQDVLTDTKIATDAEHHTDALTVTPDDAAAGKEVFIEVARFGGHADDTMTGDAILTLVEVVYSVTSGVSE